MNLLLNSSQYGIFNHFKIKMDTNFKSQDSVTADV